VNDGRAELRFDVVANDGHARLLESPSPFVVAGDEHGNAVYERDARFERTFGVEFGGVLRADWQVLDEALNATRDRPGNFVKAVVYNA
jgi:hypothetical protein